MPSNNHLCITLGNLGIYNQYYYVFKQGFLLLRYVLLKLLIYCTELKQV